MPREFEIVREVELPATPEAVWEAVATAAGNASWLFPVELPDGPDGSADGGATRTTAWDPPREFGVRTEMGEAFNALSYEISGRDGSTTKLRYAHSGIFQDDWDAQYDAVSQHTDFYLHTLGQYLAHFAPRTAVYVGDVPGGIMGPEASAQPGSLDRLLEAVGVPADATEGDSVRLEVDGIPATDAIVDYRRGAFAGLRTNDALVRFFGRGAFGGPVAVAVHLFGDQDPSSVDAAWRAQLPQVFA